MNDARANVHKSKTDTYLCIFLRKRKKNVSFPHNHICFDCDGILTLYTVNNLR